MSAGLEDIALGAIIIDEISGYISTFRSWMENLSNDNGIWYRKWKFRNTNRTNVEDKFSLGNQTQNYSITYRYAGYDSRLSVIIDAVTVLAIALQEELETGICSPIHDVSGRINCLTDNNLYPYIENHSFFGRTGPITFDKGQNINNKLRFGNMVKTNSFPGYDIIIAGTYNILEDRFTLLHDLAWENFTYYNASDAPPSCSLPCDAREIQVPSDTLCCWTCIKCGTKQKITKDPVKPCQVVPLEPRSIAVTTNVNRFRRYM